MKATSRRNLLFYLGKGCLGCAISLTLSFSSRSAHRSIKPEQSLHFLDRIATLKQVAPAKESGEYQPPTPEELKQFKQLAKALIALDWEQTKALAKALHYQLVVWQDKATQHTVLGLIETLNTQGLSRGWGSYFINPAVENETLIEAPHILFDRFTPEIASQVFLLSEARAFLMGGAHRDANGSGTADVCDRIASIFQVVHEAWLTRKSTIWQIHGFKNSPDKGFPKKTEVVISSGKGDLKENIIKFRSHFLFYGYSTYVYNELSPDDPLNQQLNGSVAGTTFSPLAGTQNVQGIHSRNIQASFVHIELERSVRLTQESRDRITLVIAAAVNS